MEEIIKVNIEEELKNSYLDYAMSVIIGRALPDVRDGLKPVHRRILYAMNVLGNFWNKPYKKSARIVGDVIGKYHPHGDNAVYETVVRLAQSFSMRYVLIDGQGNFGSVDGDPAAAMRYTEIRMTRIAHELLKDLEKETINYSLNYDNSEKIPDVMPTRIPNLLINGSSGIAVGMATNIPPHNISEVINACLAYIEDPNISVEKLIEYIPGPDFPTAAIINGKSGILQAYKTGKSKISIRAKAAIINNSKNNIESILITEIPYQVNKSSLIEKISELVREKKIDGISSVRDESDKDGMRIVIKIKKDASSEVILNNLYSLTQLQVSFSINMVALFNGKPTLLSLIEILKAFISHRKEVVIRRSIFELKEIKNHLLFLEALAVAFENINLIIELIRKSSSLKEAKCFLLSSSWKISNKLSFIFKEARKKLLLKEDLKKEFLNFIEEESKYNFSQDQVKFILDLRLNRLTNIEQSKIIEKYKKSLKSISKRIKILTNTNKLTKVIKNELKFIKDQYGDARRTKIIENVSEIQVEDLINQEEVVITLSHHGYVKYHPLSGYEAQKRGGKGKLAARIKGKDFIERLLIANTHDTILCFSSTGRLYWIKVYQLSESGKNARGRPIINLIPLKHDERITAILPIKEFNENYYVFMATSNGIVKKTLLKDFSRPKITGLIAINLNHGDKLIGVDLTKGEDEIMLFSSSGKVIRFCESSVRVTGRKAMGVRGIRLKNKDKVVSLIIPKKKHEILTVTENGYGKRTKQKEYPKKSRSTLGVISIKLNKRNGNVIGAIQVSKADQIVIITNTGALVRIRVSEISTVGRNTGGVTLIRTSKNEKVVALQRVFKPIL